jgi:hypothetical protein
MARKQGTELRFVATIAKVDISTPKKANNWAREETGGGLRIVLDIPFPKAPEEPYNLHHVPASPEKRAKETDAAFKKRQKDHEEDLALRQRAAAAYRRKLETAGPRRMQYAQLVGLASIFGSKEITVTLRPHQQDVLSGFGDLAGQTVELLPAPRDPDEDDDDPLRQDGE